MGLTVSARRDPMLDLVLAVADGMPGHHINITIITSGGIVTGKLVGYDTWLRTKSEFLRSTGPVLVAFADAFDHAADDVAIDREMHDAAAEVAEEPTPRTFHFVHITDARVIGPGALIPTGPGMHMRIRVADVAGWSMGELGTGTPVSSHPGN